MLYYLKNIGFHSFARCFILFLLLLFVLFPWAVKSDQFFCPGEAVTTSIQEAFRKIEVKEEGLASLIRKAESGDPYHQFALGRLYERGIGIDKSSERAKHWYKASLNNGFGPAGYNLGLLYLKSSGDDEFSTAFKYFKEGCTKGSADACYNAGQSLLQGKGVAKNPGRAREYFLCSGNMGNEKAYANLGALYLNKDKDKALTYFKVGAEMGDPESMYHAGRIMFLDASSDDERKTSLQLIIRAAGKGNAKAKGFIEAIR